MYNNEDRALNPVELTHEELSLASGGFGGYYGYYNTDFVDQFQGSKQNQETVVAIAGLAVIGQTQASVQTQDARTY